jgi:hypothetical protein
VKEMLTRPGVLVAAGAGLCAVAALVMVPKFKQPPAPADVVDSADVPAYYLPRDGQCTVLVDFSNQRGQLGALDNDSRAARLARIMVQEFRRHGAAKSKEAPAIQMLAVYIQGKDNYNRPDFSKRTNLLKLNGTAAQLQGLTDAELGDWQRLKQALRVEVLF